MALSFTTPVPLLPANTKAAWLESLAGVTMGSDGYIPFRDNIDQAASIGAAFVIQPGGSVADASVIDACNEYGITMICNELRLFHH